MKVWKHIKENAVEKGIFIDAVNGYSQHCHCLVSLSSEQTIAQVTQLIKGESAFWINKSNITDKKFGWQSEYWAVSVSESIIPKVRNYIFRQEKHHSKTSFVDEQNEFIRKYKMERLG